jgi:alpha-galactosidase
MEWKGQTGGNIIAFDAAAQEGLVSAGLEINNFRLDPARSSQKRVVDPEFGPGLEATIVGSATASVARIGGGGGVFRMERAIRVLLPDKYPDAAIFQSTYRNLENRPLHIDRVYSQRVLLDRSLAEPTQPPYALASFQGGAYRWGTDYAVMRLNPDFKQSNFQGIDDVNGPEGTAGGMPFVDAWGPTMGVAIAHLEKTPQWLSLPVEVRPDRRVELAVTESPLEKYAQQEWLKPQGTFQTVLTCVIFHRLDYFDPLKIYGQLLRARGIAIPDKSPDSAYEPYWKSWGWGRNFTVDKFYAIHLELKSMGSYAPP